MTRLLPSLLLAAACHGGPGPDARLVVLISIDTLRADHVGLFGSERPTTPHLDRFFGDATVFTQASSSAPCTIPSVRQTLSGGFDLAPQRKRLPELLQADGFRTVASTSQHFFRDPKGEYPRGFDVFETQGPREVDRSYGMTTRTGDTVVDRGIALLDGWPWQTGDAFLWMHLYDPHDPYEPPPPYREWDEGYTGARPDGDRRKYLMDERPGTDWLWMEAGSIFTPEDVAHFRALYDGEIAFADAQLGRFFDHLEARGWADKATVVFWSDHGEFLGEDDAWDHCRTLHQRETHVPLMVRHRGEGLDGLDRVDTAASTLDILPTVAGLLGLGLAPDTYHGLDLRALPPDRKAISMWRTRRAVRDSRYKLMIRDGTITGLYDLKADPMMTKNVASDHPDVIRAFAEELQRFPELEERVAKENEETMQMLEDVGYVEAADEALPAPGSDAPAPASDTPAAEAP